MRSYPIGFAAVALTSSLATCPGDGSGAKYFAQSATAGACVDNSFYVESGRIHLCPTTCTALKADTGAKVDVLFTCGSTIL